MKILIEYLARTNAKIQASKPSDDLSYDKFICLVCDDFFEKIMSNPTLKKWFEGKLFYMKNLAGNPDVIHLQKRSLEIINEMATILCKREYVERIFKLRGIVSYKYFGGGWNQTYTDEEFIDDLYSKAKSAFNTTEYPILEYGKNAPYDEKVSTLVPTYDIVEKYKALEGPKHALRQISEEESTIEENDNMERLEQEYMELQNKLTLEIITKPTRYHTKSFEDLTIIRTEHSPIDSCISEQARYRLRTVWGFGRMHVDNIKKDVEIVFEELKLVASELEKVEKLKDSSKEVADERTTPETFDKVLDKDIRLRRQEGKNILLIKESDDGTYEIKKIRPMDAWLIERSFSCRSNKKKRIFHPKDIAKNYTKPANPNSIRTGIKRINDFCMDCGVKPIFTSRDKGYFDLNSELDCMESLRSSSKPS